MINHLYIPRAVALYLLDPSESIPSGSDSEVFDFFSESVCVTAHLRTLYCSSDPLKTILEFCGSVQHSIIESCMDYYIMHSEKSHIIHSESRAGVTETPLFRIQGKEVRAIRIRGAPIDVSFKKR